MSGEHDAALWEQADRLFEEALDRPKGERKAFLDAACAGEARLRELVDRLVFEAEHTDTFLPPGGALDGELGAAIAAELLEAGEDDLKGAILDRWRVIEEIGRGGMAVVYLAERSDGQFEQRVALKLVRQGLDSEEALWRFRQERQILALTNHPAIGRIFDGGVAPDGRPFFVMEHVRGRPIDVYCDEERLGVRQRLELFLDAARAVEYAHRNLIVHRDIKPSNLLVSGEGEVKLLDFGIAKALEPVVPDQGDTRSTARLLTPAWASPEQVLGLPVTTASDVYQLGLLLYRLLTGRLPYRADEKRAALLARAIVEEPALVPSRVASGLPDGKQEPGQALLAATARAAQLRLSPRGLRRALAGDLDAIVLKALRKEPEQRYRSVGQLIDDVERHLAGRLVGARPATPLYRATSYVRRRWLLVSLASLAAVSLAGGLVATTWQARRAERRFEEGRRLARTLLFELHDAIAALPGSTRAREQLVMTSLEYLDGLTEEAGGDPELLRELADAYERVGDVQGGPRTANLGEPSAAIASYERALALRTRLAARGDTHDDVELRRGLARVRVKRADLLTGQGRFDEALSELHVALDGARALQGRADRGESDYELLVDAWGTLGSAQARLNDTAAAVESFRAGLGVAESWHQSHPGPSATRAVSLAHARLGNTLAEQGALVAGIAHLERAVALAEQAARVRPDDREALRDVRVLNAWLGNVLGVPAYVNRGDLATARERYRRALEAAEALAARDPGDAQARLGLAIVLWRLGSLETERDPRAARELIERALAILDELLQLSPGSFDNQRRRAGVRLSLAVALERAGDGRPALALLEELLEENTRFAERRDSDVAVRSARRAILQQLGAARLRRNQPRAALESTQAALALAEEWIQKRPEDVYALAALAESHAGVAAAHAALAADATLPTDTRREHARQAEQHQRKRLTLWQQWTMRVPEAPYGAEQRAATEADLRTVQTLAHRLEAASSSGD